MEVMLKGLFRGMLVVAMSFAAPVWAQDNARQVRSSGRVIPTKAVDYEERDVTPRRMYFGGNVGVSRYDLDQDGFDAFTAAVMDDLGFSLDSGTSTLDNESNAFALVAGLRLSKNFSVEGNFVDFGKTDYRADVNVDDGIDLGMATLSARLRTRALGFSLLGTLPLGRGFDLHAMLGRYSVETRLDTTVNLPDGSSAKLARTADSNQILYGFGASNRIGERWTIDVDYQVLQTSDSFTGDVRAVLIGFQFRL
jgi:hypothetical protein